MSETRGRRVVVTGLGIQSAVGGAEELVFDQLMAGQTGLAQLESLDVSMFKCQIGGEADSEPINDTLKRLKRRPVDRSLDLAMVAAYEALHQANLLGDDERCTEPEIPVVIGTGTGSAQSHYEAIKAFAERGPHRIRPTSVPRCMYNAISAGISIQFGLTGANYMVVSACTSGTNAIGQAFRMIRDGYADVVLTGGSDGFFDPFFFGIWNNLGVLSQNPDPARACRPFDADRDGCVFGEGAGIFVLESLEHARARGIDTRGEIRGYAETSDASHITSPSPEGQAEAMRRALADAGVKPSDLGLVSAHGTATPANDTCESTSIERVLGDAAQRVPVSALKSYFGHTLGASGAVETASCLLMIERGTCPPNLNLDRPDPECHVHLVGTSPEPLERPLVMKNSFGFGGGNGVLILGPAP